MMAPMEGKRLLVTGGAGFLGSHFVRHALNSGASEVVNFDVLSYAGDLTRLSDLADRRGYRFVRGDVTSRADVSSVLEGFDPDIVVHYAAESHVTRSENAAEVFDRTNVEGTRVLLEAAAASGVERFVHISTDEVYGPILRGAFKEEDKLAGDSQAKSPYAKSKSLADDLALSFADRLSVNVARPTNAFGPNQFPEKAFPRWVTRGLRGEPLLVWGDGLYVRQWLYAEDLASAIAILAENGSPGEVYNVGPKHDPEITNLDLAKWIIGYLVLPEDRLVLTEYDRPDHDRRYSVDASKIFSLGWAPGEVWGQFEITVEWYRSNPHWWEPHIPEAESIYTDAPAR